MGPRGYPKLDPRNYYRRFERFRLIAFQNTKKFCNRPTKNIFSARGKLAKKIFFQKSEKIPGNPGISYLVSAICAKWCSNLGLRTSELENPRRPQCVIFFTIANYRDRLFPLYIHSMIHFQCT